MEKESFVNKGVLTGNMLKIIALITMTIDHVGYFLYPTEQWLRIIGRIAFPIFAFLIAEGCRYTRNKKKYFITMLIFAVVCQVAMSIATGSLTMNIFVTFIFSQLMIFAFDQAVKTKKISHIVIALVTFTLIAVIMLVIPSVVPRTLGLSFDYGFFGALLPLFVYLGRNKISKVILCAIGLLPLCLTLGFSIQWYCYLALIPLALYNGKRGKLKLKYLFYFYYPVHVLIILLISMLM